ncbi:ribosomal large subunit pseudouridine synthase C [Mycoplasmopsis columbina SF7]|uniref:RNA pseudouridylate synthase n=1 Tax=Mycoplasmopsis columbina SF7 TaxID=1037410 RepID=F9UJG0_9BACT|nr:RluA family pseudouridine synthase [Mycoplasmopsis columbina]EGV00503.1 ribosomal large subunit pseudouridine synthase C [Mycoplasmopsis columbina SF7]
MKKNNWKSYVIKENNEEKKLFSFLKELFENHPLAFIYKLLRQKDVKVNGVRTKDEKYKLLQGDVVEVFYAKELSKTKEFDNKDIQINFQIIYEDSNILLVNKPTKVSVHSEFNCLDHQVLKYLSYRHNLNEFRPSHVGRLDKETSGIMIYAKNHYALVQLNANTSKFDKIYVFKSDYNGNDQEILLNVEKNSKGYLNNTTNKTNLAYSQAHTKIYQKNNIWFAQIFTGKKHQIRLSLKSLNFPIWGDKKYGGKKAERLYLHCKTIKFKELEGKLNYLNNKEFTTPIPWERK